METIEHLFAATTPGLERALSTEARSLGMQATEVIGGVELSGPSGLHQDANLRLRCASRVLLRLARFSAPDAKGAVKGLKAVDVTPFLGGRRDMALSISCHASRLSRPQQIKEIAADAWNVEVLGDEEGHPHVMVRLVEDVCTVSVDTSGELLHRRGYRQETSMAPLRETLAAGILVMAGYDGSEPLWDPMCGSGTLLIEAALMAQRRVPGWMRSFAFQRWPSFREGAWRRKLDAARSEERTISKPLWGSDIHSGALGTARRNARRAGVLEALSLERKDAARIAPPAGSERGLLVANLPYGKRVGHDADLAALYRAFAERIRTDFAGWRVALLTREEDAGLLALPGMKAHPLQNGGIRCCLMTSQGS